MHVCSVANNAVVTPLIVIVSDIIPVSAVNSTKTCYYRFLFCAFLFFLPLQLAWFSGQSVRQHVQYSTVQHSTVQYSTLIATWRKANLSSAAQQLPAAVLENQLDTTKPQLALLQEKICCYQTSYMSHLEGASYWGGDQKHLGLLFKRNEE